MPDLRQSFELLRAAAASGELETLCAHYGVDMVVGFGSAAHDGEGLPNDIDLAVLFHDENVDVLGFLEAIAEIAGTSRLDLMNIARAGPVARERALVGGIPLVERFRGIFTRAQMAAMTERMDTAWLRRWDLELMAG